MRMKLHRNRRVFRSRHPLARGILWAVIAAAVVGLSFFGAKYITEHPLEPDIEQSAAPAPSESTPIEPESTPNDNIPDPIAPTHDAMRGFYLPTASILNSHSLSNTLQQAANAGFTHVIFDLKDSDGNLYFRSETSRAVQANAFTDNSLSLDEVKATLTTIREAGLLPIPRLYAFMDAKAARVLANARITVQGNPTYVWYDGKPDNGGRPWLNPYADEAQLYIIEMAKELRDLGAAGIMLDGVQFPRQTSSAYFGDSTLSHDEVLTAFIEKARTMLGDACPVLLSCTADGALGNDTAVYGGNPLTFTPTIASPMLLTGSMPAQFTIGNDTIDNNPDNLAATVTALVNQLSLRIKVMPQDRQPILTPWLQTQDYTPTQIKAAISGCLDGGADRYILYHPDGIYDFTVLS